MELPDLVQTMNCQPKFGMFNLGMFNTPLPFVARLVWQMILVSYRRHDCEEGADDINRGGRQGKKINETLSYSSDKENLAAPIVPSQRTLTAQCHSDTIAIGGR